MNKPNSKQAKYMKDMRKSQCLQCDDERIIHAHHIWNKKHNPNNIIPLCPTCHAILHRDGYDYYLIGRILGMMRLLRQDLNIVMDNIDKSHNMIVKNYSFKRKSLTKGVHLGVHYASE